MLGIDIVDDVARAAGGRLAPAHVPDLRRDGAEIGVAATVDESGGREGRVLQDARVPGQPAIGGAIHVIAAVGRAAAALVHGRQVDAAVRAGHVAGHLNVAAEGGEDGHRSGPGGAAVGGEGGAEGTAAYAEVVIGDVGAAVEGAGGVVVLPGRVAVAAAGTGVDTTAGRPGSASIGGKPRTDALPTAAGGQEFDYPPAVQSIVDDGRVAEVGAVPCAEGVAGEAAQVAPPSVEREPLPVLPLPRSL